MSLQNAAIGPQAHDLPPPYAAFDGNDGDLCLSQIFRRVLLLDCTGTLDSRGRVTFWQALTVCPRFFWIS